MAAFSARCAVSAASQASWRLRWPALARCVGRSRALKARPQGWQVHVSGGVLSLGVGVVIGCWWWGCVVVVVDEEMVRGEAWMVA